MWENILFQWNDQWYVRIYYFMFYCWRSVCFLAVSQETGRGFLGTFGRWSPTLFPNSMLKSSLLLIYCYLAWGMWLLIRVWALGHSGATSLRPSASLRHTTNLANYQENLIFVRFQIFVNQLNRCRQAFCLWVSAFHMICKKLQCSISILSKRTKHNFTENCELS